ncbi:hypothetical protein [Enterovirga aerilata]|nr:hypothetical protein [Enterovirga sp. DB1703]
MTRGNIGYAVTVGFDGSSPREIFVSTHRNTGEMTALARDAAILASLALQYGCPLHVMQAALTRESDGTAAGLAGAVIDQIIERGIAA